MELSSFLLEELSEQVNSAEKINARSEDAQRFMMFNGKSNEVIQNFIQQSFSMQQTVDELTSRIVPLNITEKIIKKVSKVYVEDPIRRSRNGDSDDDDLIAKIENQCLLNTSQKYGNYYWNLFKRNLQEIYVDDYGMIRLLNIPKHKYEVFSIKSKNIWVPDVVCKIKKDHSDKRQQVLVWWSDESHFITDGHGKILKDKMSFIDNLDGVNPYGTIPFIYNNSAFYSVNPFEDDDLIKYSILIPLVLTDLLYGLKYQCFSLIVTVGVDSDIPFNPNTVLNLQRDADGNEPSVQTIQPSVDADKVLSTVKDLLGYLLTTKNLSADTISNVTTSNAQSGISKALDSAELIEDRKEQMSWFKYAEIDLFSKLKNNLIPYYLENNMLKEIDRNFSDDFELDITFPEPKVMQSKLQQIEESTKLIESNLSSWTRELKKHNPNLTESDIIQLKEEIAIDLQERMNLFNDES